MPGSRCAYWDCGRPIEAGHFLCREHFEDMRDGFIDQCPICNRFKDAQYNLCLDCYHGRSVFPRQPQTQEDLIPPKRYEREHSPAWASGDATTNTFFVYILKLDGGNFYAGQTRELRERLQEHKDGKVATTRGRHPKLQWFGTTLTRETATAVESELKKLVDTNPRQIRRMIIQFKDWVKEMEFD